MDPNLLFWKSHGQSFLERAKIWFDLLDPLHLITHDAEIQKDHSLLESDEKRSDEQRPIATTLSLSSVHSDTGEVLPVFFRPPALIPACGPLVCAAFLPHMKVKVALFFHLMLQSYFMGFNYTHRNMSSKQEKAMSEKQMLVSAGIVCHTTLAGALPQILIKQLRVTSQLIQNQLRVVLPVPLAGLLAYTSLHYARSEELENGIQVFNSEGNELGLSRAAAHKAVRETALSRAVLLGTSAAVPNLLLILQGGGLLKKYSTIMAPIRVVSVLYTFALMIPVSFSLFPQLGTIKKEEVEKSLQAAAGDGPLFYHRGV